MCYEKKWSQNFEEIQGQYLRRSPFMESGTVALKLIPSSIFARKFFQNAVLFPKTNSSFRLAHFSCYIRVLVQLWNYLNLTRHSEQVRFLKLGMTGVEPNPQTLLMNWIQPVWLNHCVYSFMIQDIVTWNPISL